MPSIEKIDTVNRSTNKHVYNFKIISVLTTERYAGLTFGSVVFLCMHLTGLEHSTHAALYPVLDPNRPGQGLDHCV